MGGRDKSALPAPHGGTLLQRELGLADELGWEAVVVGLPPGDGPFPVAAAAGAPQLRDAPAGIGPLGGLGPLLRHAGDRPMIALACDLPYVEAALLRRLAAQPTGPDVVAPRLGQDWWMPLCARYAPAAVLPALQLTLDAGQRSLQALLRRLSVAELSLDDAERHSLRDWDTPQDMPEDMREHMSEPMREPTGGETDE